MAEASEESSAKMVETLGESMKNLLLEPQATANFSAPKAPIVIAYRDEGKEKGKAPYYDHYVAQKATDHPTRIACPTEMKLDGLISYLKSTAVFELPEDGKKPPEVIPNSFEGGLLLIPGRTRVNENDSVRTSHETNLIKEALLRGQPILAICAGCWRLWKEIGGTTCDVQGHCDRRGMMFIGVQGNVVRNVLVHRIAVEQESLLAKAMGYGAHDNLPVNSLHWKAPDEKIVPKYFSIGARAVADNELAPRNSTGDGQKVHVQSGTVEAFESSHGAPVLGIQWHPEAYNASDEASIQPVKHLNLLKFMANAGTAYTNKQKMLEEYKNKYLQTHVDL